MKLQLLTAGLNLSLCIYIHLAFLPWREEEGTRMWQIFVILPNGLLEEDQMLCWWIRYKRTLKETEMFTKEHGDTQALFRLLFLVHWRNATVKVIKEAMVFDNQTPALYCPSWSTQSQQRSLAWMEISIPNQIVISSFYVSCLFYDVSVGVLLICSLLDGWIFLFHLWIPIILHHKWGNVSK